MLIHRATPPLRSIQPLGLGLRRCGRRSSLSDRTHPPVTSVLRHATREVVQLVCGTAANGRNGTSPVLSYECLRSASIWNGRGRKGLSSASLKNARGILCVSEVAMIDNGAAGTWRLLSFAKVLSQIPTLSVSALRGSTPKLRHDA